MSYLNLASIRECTISEGPGKRFALWVQGCKFRCPDCCNKFMQEIAPKHIVDTKDIISKIYSSYVTYGIEGVTFLGGEPMLQAEGLSYIAEWCNKNKLSVMTFSGYLLEYLKSRNNYYINKLLDNTDIFVDGPFVKELYETKRDWVGSSNQKIYYFTDRYKKGLEYKSKTHRMEINISVNDIKVNGWPFCF